MTLVDRARPEITTERLMLRLISPAEAPKLVVYFRENAAHFAPTDPPHPKDFGSERFFRSRLELAELEYTHDRSMRLGMFRQLDGQLIGTANFTHVQRGPLQQALLGYGLDYRVVGQGFMVEGLRAALQFVWETLELHRVSAGYLPDNVRSANVLRALGFSVEGYARSYLFIAGQWRDHVLTSLVSPRHVEPK